MTGFTVPLFELSKTLISKRTFPILLRLIWTVHQKDKETLQQTMSDCSEETVELLYLCSDKDSYSSEVTVAYHSDTSTPTQDEVEDHMDDYFSNPQNWIVLSETE